MDFFKKIGKEVSVFGLVFVVFIALFAYRQATHVGSDKDNTTLNYKNVCLKYLEKNHSDKIYYVNLAKENNATTYIQKTFKTDDGTIPSTFVMKNGKVKVQKSGSLSYYRIAELFK